MQWYRLALIIPSLVMTYNLWICRTYFQTIPDSIVESSKIDGANDLKLFLRIILPMSLPILAVMTLFYAVDKWNTYFAALLYLQNPKLQPIQIYLSRVLTLNVSNGLMNNINDGGMRVSLAQNG